MRERNGLKYGKLVVNRSTTSYEVSGLLLHHSGFAC